MGSNRRMVMGAGLLLATVLASAGEPTATAPVKLDIKSQPMADALNKWAQATGFQVIFPEESATAKLVAPEVRGRYVPAAALTKLLEHSGLRYEYLNERTVSVKVAQTGQTSPSSDQDKENARPLGVMRAQGEGPPPRELSRQSDTGGSQGSGQDNSRTVEEIVVSAQKKIERLQDVPVPVTAINAGALVNNNQVHLQDYYSSVPGLDLALDNRGSPALAVRGLTTSLYGNPTVGVTLDDVPYGATTASAFQWAAMDFDPNELSQIEVLRGPQGTLYGASSLGGLLKFETIDPSLDGPSGRVQAGITNVFNGKSLGYSASAAANIPLADTLAIRVSAFNRLDPGYITNTLTGQESINWGDVDGARLSALWRPTEDFSAKLSALVQDGKTYGAPYVESVSEFGDLQQSYIRGTGGYDRELQAYSLVLRDKLGPVGLTSITGYGINTSSGSFDVSNLLGALAHGQFGVDGDAWVEHNSTHKFTEEVRLTAQIGEKLEWLIGGFYTNENTQLNGGHIAFDPLTGKPAGALISVVGPVSYEEYAAFTHLTFHFSDRFDIQIGGRESENRQSYSQVQAGPLTGQSSAITSPEFHSKDNSFTYLLTPKLKISDDLMVYARFASGYRPGGPNTTLIIGSGGPVSFGPDETQNSEIGFKGDLFERAVSIDGSLYYITWKDLQTGVSSVSNGGYTINIGQAKSQGAELSIESRPLKGLTVSAWGAWNLADLTKAFPPTSNATGMVGDRLPYSARFSGTFSVRQEIPFENGAVGFASLSASYVGERQGEFIAGLGTTRQTFPAYTKTDLRAGASYGTWTTNIYVNNVSNQRGQLSGGQGTLNAEAFTYIQPRTIGLSVAKSF